MALRIKVKISYKSKCVETLGIVIDLKSKKWWFT